MHSGSLFARPDSPAGPPVTAHSPRRLYRDPGNRIVAGVAAGLAEHLGAPVVVIRAVFVALLALNGLGALLYVAFWAVLPVSPGAAMVRRRGGALQILGMAAVVAGVIMVQAQVGFGLNSTLVALLVLVSLGVGIIWHQLDPERRRLAPDLTDSPVSQAMPRSVDAGMAAAGGRWLLLRLIGGGVLVVTGIIGLLAFLAPLNSKDLGAILTGLLFALLALAGVILALAPLLYRVFGQLREERVARIREQERAEVAAMVHDQVLHTLALIQRRSGDPIAVLRLARGQERTLRNWLYKPSGSPTERFAAALEQVAAEVEDTYGVGVETVVVGDAENDGQVAALIAATREALVNAGRHANVGTVSLYAEADPESISVYVRDRGAGFDLSTISNDRQGVRGSIMGRMHRHGGRAVIRTAPGEGTEVELTLPRREARHHE